MSRNSKGQFVKRGGGGGKSRKRKATALIVASPRTVTKYRTRTVKAKPRRSKGKHAGGMPKLLPMIGTGIAVGWLLGDKSPVPQAREIIMKIPGAKTFGPEAAFGVAALAIDRYAYKSKWLKLAGVIGVGLAAVKLGNQNTGFKWLGDEDGDDDGGMISDVE